MKYLTKTQKLMSGASKRFWVFWLPLTLVGLVAVYLAFALLEKVVAERLDATIESSSRLVHTQLNNDIQEALVDLEFISQSRLLREFLISPTEKRKVYLDAFFSNFALSHKNYGQIRLLSDQGMELSRINFASGVPEIVMPDKLQNKSDRYYFKEAKQLKPGQTYVSRIDLNVERGKIELPYKPVIRFAKPLYDAGGQVMGIVVLNYLAAEVLDNFRALVGSLPGEKMLLNDSGFWLSSDVRSREWGFMLDHSQSFSQLYPELWGEIKVSETGIIDSEFGRTNFYTIKPPFSSESRSLGAWKFVVINTNHRMGLPFLHEHLAYLYPLLLAYLFSTALLWMWARADSGKEIAEKELIALNRLLEKKVEKRTAELEATKDAAILSLATLAETRDNETGQHIFRTQHYVKVLAEALQDHPDFKDQLDGNTIQRIFKSAPLHDIGKVGIPDEILLKHGELDEHEQQVMRCHTTLGSDAIEEAITSISNRLAIKGAGTFLHCARDIAHYHHERWDGKGYPKGLLGDAIPLPARLMAVADVYDALVTDRVYKTAFTREETEDVILNKSPGQFDPRILEAFAAVKDQFWEIKQRFAD